MAEPHILHDNEKSDGRAVESGDGILEKIEISSEVNPKPPSSTATQQGKDFEHGETSESDNVIIRTGADASAHLIELRDDFDPALTFRSIFIASILACFQAVMHQIYAFKPTQAVISGTFIVLIAYFMGNAWAAILPRGDKLEAKWRAKGNTGAVPTLIRVVSFFNHGPWGLKEHAICSITATSASAAGEGIQVFTAQKIFYEMELSAVTVVLATISIGLFGYGLAGIFRQFLVYHVEAVYWGTLPTVKTLQGLHWGSIKSSKPVRAFWIAFAAMFFYEILPAYIWPWLNSVSIPCLAAMGATGLTAKTLNILFGGSLNNQGLGLFSISLDWQYITSFSTSLPLSYQVHQGLGIVTCMLIMLILWYGNVWNAQSQPFMATRLRTREGGTYPTSKVFIGGVLDKTAFAKYGVPELTATFAYGMFAANAAIGALITHCFLFWGKDVVHAYKDSRNKVHHDRHHDHMVKHYKETPWWWFVIVLVISFVMGLVVVLVSNITLPAWGYIAALALGCFVAPLSTLLYSRFGNGIATNNLSKMLAGLMVPERPVGNMYFAAWSHSVIANCVGLSNDLKLGEYLKIPPRVMFITQLYGTILGGFVNYVVMISIVTGNEEMLATTDGSNAWSGASLQGYNTNASAWALAHYLYGSGSKYAVVPYGLLAGALLVAAHRVFVHFYPRIGKLDTRDINLPQFIQYAGYIPYNQTQTCVIFSTVISGFFVQYYLRNHKPRIFRDYYYMVAGAFDGAALLMLFILSFAVFGAGGKPVAFPKWWGNNRGENLDLCPSTSP
ncbi:oligopeptide transporter 8 [Naviculisporaceae sp. PSN 640]